MVKWMTAILFSFFLLGYAKIFIPNDLQIDISSMAKCPSTGDYPIEVDNVAVNLNDGKITVTGTLITILDLDPPLKAVLKVERHKFGIWINIPCINNIGSCTYDDLCIHSIPTNETCPKSFIDNNVPCRCPIPKGSYTIPSELKFEIRPQNYFSVYSGKYWARAVITHKDLNLACYDVYFQIEDKSLYEGKKEEAHYNNYLDRPFVTLI